MKNLVLIFVLVFCATSANAQDCKIAGDLTSVAGPKLVFSSDSVMKTIASAVRRQNLELSEVLVVASARNQGDLRDVSQTVYPSDNRVETINESAKTYSRVKLVIGLGGMRNIDYGRFLAAQIKAKFVGVATVLTTTGLSVDRSVVTVNGRSMYLKGVMPVETIVHLPSIESMPQALLASSNASGVGDFLAGLSASVDRNKDVPQDIAMLGWLSTGFRGWSRSALKHLACELHQEGLREIRDAGHESRVAGEHAFYNKLVELNSEVAAGRPSHGLVVAVGTLIALKIFAEQTNDALRYNQLKSVFRKIGLPSTWADLQAAGLSREVILSGLHGIHGGSTFLGAYFVDQTSDSILDRVFGDAASGAK